MGVRGEVILWEKSNDPDNLLGQGVCFFLLGGCECDELVDLYVA